MPVLHNIVKRRLIWRLPGVLGLARGVRAQSLRTHGWPSRPEMGEGLEVGRKLVLKASWLLAFFGMLLTKMLDWRCLTARHRIYLEKLVLRYGPDVARRDILLRDHTEHVDGI